MSDKSRIEQNNTDINNLKEMLNTSASVIDSLPNTSACTATAEDLIKDRVAVGLTGNIVGTLDKTIGSVELVNATAGTFFTPPSTVWDSVYVSLDANSRANLQPENIKSGISICGVNGTLTAGTGSAPQQHVFSDDSELNASINSTSPLMWGDIGIIYSGDEILMSALWPNGVDRLKFPERILASDIDPYGQYTYSIDASSPFVMSTSHGSSLIPTYTIGGGSIQCYPGNGFMFSITWIRPLQNLGAEAYYTLYVEYTVSTSEPTYERTRCSMEYVVNDRYSGICSLNTNWRCG